MPCTVILLSPLQSIPVPAAKALAAETTMSVMAITQAMSILEICLLILTSSSWGSLLQSTL